MSGIEALSLVASIMQVIMFTGETISLCKTIYQQGSSPDSHLGQRADTLATLSADIQGHAQGKPQTPTQRSLADIAAKCNIAARALAEEIQFITSHQKKGSLVAVLRVAAKTIWRKRRLERLEKSLSDYRHTLEAHLLADIW
jgi:hypothetical protein